MRVDGEAEGKIALAEERGDGIGDEGGSDGVGIGPGVELEGGDIAPDADGGIGDVVEVKRDAGVGNSGEGGAGEIVKGGGADMAAELE